MFLFLDRHKNIIHFWKLKSVVFYIEVERENRQREKNNFYHWQHFLWLVDTGEISFDLGFYIFTHAHIFFQRTFCYDIVCCPYFLILVKPH